MTGTALFTTPLGQVREVKSLLMNENALNQLKMVAARHMNPERVMRVVASAIRTTPKLANSDPMSFLGALMQCAALGLEPNTVLGHAYLIPFDRNKKVKNPETGRDEWKKVTEVQVIVGYKGLIDLARRSGHITSLAANIHYDDDELWDYEEGTESRLRHRPGLLRGKKLHAYAIAKFKDGGHAYVVLPWAHVMKIRDDSQNWQSAVRGGKTADSPWAKHEDEMAKKTAIRALAKYLPLSIEFTQAVEIDEANADFRSFAFDPSAGITVDDDAIEGEAAQEGAGEQVAKIEDKSVSTDKPARRSRHDLQQEYNRSIREKTGDTQAHLEEPKQQAQSTPVEEARPAREHEAQKAPQAETKPAPATSERTDMFRRLADMILGDLDDGADLGEVRELYDEQLTQMKAAAPDIFAELQEQFAEYEKTSQSAGG